MEELSEKQQLENALKVMQGIDPAMFCGWIKPGYIEGPKALELLKQATRKWIMLLSMEQNSFLEHLGDQSGCGECIDKWMLDDSDNIQYIEDTPGEVLLKAGLNEKVE